MRRAPSWIWLLLGAAVGTAVTALVLERTRIDQLEIWSASTAMQGWVGALIAAVGSLAAAVLVLWMTLVEEQRRFEKQRRADDARFADQRRFDGDRARKQVREDRKRVLEAAQQERQQFVESKRIETWARLVGTAREFFWYSVDANDVRAMEKQLSAVFFEWAMYTSAADEETVDGVLAVISAILMASRDAADSQRVTNDRVLSSYRSERIRTPADDLVVDLGRYGMLVHRNDPESQRRGVDWFRSQRRDELSAFGD